jgi:hypothetical protein
MPVDEQRNQNKNIVYARTGPRKEWRSSNKFAEYPGETVERAGRVPLARYDSTPYKFVITLRRK